jgi:hypothetical protein
VRHAGGADDPAGADLLAVGAGARRPRAVLDEDLRDVGGDAGPAAVVGDGLQQLAAAIRPSRRPGSSRRA